MRAYYEKWLKGPFFIPSLFLLYHYKLWLGWQTLAADTGDGIGAYKFFTLPVRYWNWYENGGQPYWTELAIYRLQDPLLWPLILFTKSLPISLVQQFNLYILLRIALLGVGTYYLLKSLGCKTFSRQCGTLLALFGSAFPIMFRSIGALDLITVVIGISLFTVKFFQTEKRIYLWLVALVLVHAALTYHILYLAPFVPLLLLFFWSEAKQILQALTRFKMEVAFCALAVCAAYGAEYLAVKDPQLLPVLRSIRYNTWVDEQGKVINKEWGVGESVLDTKSLSGDADECGKRFHCRFYDLSLLSTFWSARSAWSLTGYVSLLGLGLLAASLLFLRQRVFLLLLTVAAGSFILGLGTQTPLWSFTQTVFFPLQFVRHTGFYFHLFVFLLCLMIAFTLEKLSPRLHSKAKFIIFSLLFVDLLFFHRTHVVEFLNFVKEGQIEKIEAPSSGNFSSRVLRIYNPYLIPRSSAATTYGEPSALESIFVQDTITSDHIQRGENPRHFGFITLFVSKGMMEERIGRGEDLEKFKENVGVAPFGVLTPITERRNAVPLEIQGESLIANLNLAKDTTFYLAVPIESVGTIFLDGKKISFAARETGYGTLFSASKGIHSLEIQPYLGRKNLIYFLYYGAFLILLIGITQPAKFLSRIFRETSFNLAYKIRSVFVSG